MISSVFIPLIGDKRARGWPGKRIDILALVTTIGGIGTSLGLGVLRTPVHVLTERKGTSLGLGVLQINAGLNRLFGAPQAEGVQLLLILVLAVI